jgi:hypothetical protein
MPFSYPMKIDRGRLSLGTDKSAQASPVWAPVRSTRLTQATPSLLFDGDGRCLRM